MEVKIHYFCCGCLSVDRKMKLIHEYWADETFLKIFTEISIPISESDGYSYWLCWECEAHISKFLTFREQLKRCFKTLQEYGKEIHNTQLKTVSKLTVSTRDSVNINSNEVNEPHIKNEEDNVIQEDTNPNIKDETEVYSDDNRSLFDIRNERIMKSPRKNNNLKRKLRNNAKAKGKRKQNILYERLELTPEEVLRERVLMELKEEFVNSMFKCEKCITTFANSDDLEEHTLTKHELHASKHTCRVCERTFGKEHSLWAHSRRHSLRWRCVVCKHRSETERAAQAHYRDRHEERNCKNEMLELATKIYQSYSKKSDDIVEDKRTKSKEQIPCEYCDKTFRWRTSLRKHMEAHRIEAGHKRKPYCETCNLSFTNTSNLRKHITTSSKHQIKLKLRKLKDHAVDTSDPVQQAKDLESIKSKINSQKEQFQCPQCEKKFQWKGNLLRHLNSHAARANGDLICEPCNRTFSSIATYKQHMKISRKHVSENEFKYMCSDCGKRFSNKTKLRDHIDWEHLKKYTHICSVCQKAFKSHTSLYLHRQVVHRLYHADHLCDHCGKSFPNKTKLGTHITALHSRESPYKCDTCSARFNWHSCLSRHVSRVHGGALRTSSEQVKAPRARERAQEQLVNK